MGLLLSKFLVKKVLDFRRRIDYIKIIEIETDT